ncbi:MAG: IctB family putative bicarbonate transporter [Leptolyngbyaceae cyanobacterium bins.302]|nr:IctB family putative bicarbonate transporter [Leptolyngbyaceae cyanobacterium bins.302]
MNSVWQTLTLSTLPLQRWLDSSYLHYPIGRLRAWRKGSSLMRWAEAIGGVLAMLVFALAPFANNTLTGLLLGACGAYWALVTLSDEGSNADEVDQEVESDTRKGVSRNVPTDPSLTLLPSHSPTSNPQPLTPPFPSLLATPIHFLVGLYWSIAVAATALSPVKREAFVGLQKLTLYLLFFLLLARVLRSPRIRSWVIAVFLLAALAVSVYGIQQWFMGTDALATWVDPESPLSKTTRVYSYLGNPNLLAGYLVPAVVFSIVAFFSWRTWMCKALAIVMTVVNGACLMLTFSRGGWIGLVFALLVLTLLLAHWWSIYLPRFWRTLALPIVLGTAMGVVLLAIVVLEPLRDRVTSIFAGRGDSSNNFRINVWMAVLDMIRDRPLLGIGPGNNAFNKIYPLYQRPRFSALSAYSIVLEVAVETGIIGLVAFLWLIFVTLAQGWKALNFLRETSNQQGYWLMGAIASLVGMFGHGTVDTVLYRPEVNTLWWLMFALIASYYSVISTFEYSKTQ